MYIYIYMFVPLAGGVRAPPPGEEAGAPEGLDKLRQDAGGDV